MPATFTVERRNPEDTPFRAISIYVDSGMVLRITSGGVTQTIHIGRTRPRIKASVSSVHFVGVVVRNEDGLSPLVSCDASGWSTIYTDFRDSLSFSVDSTVEPLLPAIAQELETLCEAFMRRRKPPMGGKPLLNPELTKAGFSIASFKVKGTQVLFTIWHKENDSSLHTGSRACSACYDVDRDQLTFMRQLDAARRGYIKSTTDFVKTKMQEAQPPSSFFSEEAVTAFKGKALAYALAQ